MPLADLALDHGVLEWLWRGERAEHVRDVRPALAHPVGELFLGEVVGLHEELVRARRLDRVQVGALQVLDERELESIAHVLAHDRRDGRLAGGARREDAAVSGDELVAVAIPRYHYRLQDPMTPDGGGELLDPRRIELRARLLGVRHDLLERDLARGRGR